jgi:hypothetical protein
MIRVAIFLVALFLVLFVARVLRLLLASVLQGRRARTLEGEMVRDPVCGVWIDRRLAVEAVARSGTVPVCSEACRLALQRKAAP